MNNIAQQIIRLRDNDLRLRDRLTQSGQLSDEYNEEMKAMHTHNAEAMRKIINTIGYPTKDKVGAEANEAAWLVVQHAIGNPDLMKRSAALLQQLPDSANEDPRHLAFLTDRIASYEDQPQLYGTQYDWDEDGLLSPKPYDDRSKVNHRRKSIGLNSMEEQTLVMRQRAEREGQRKPDDFAVRQAAYDEWRKEVGWIK